MADPIVTAPKIHHATCPICDRTQTSAVRHRYGLVVIVDFLCPDGHGWQTKWVEVAA